MRRALLLALLLVAASAILGATVLREPIAVAASPFTNVIVGNTADKPVPVTGTVAIDGAVQVTSTAAAPVPYQHAIFFNQSPETCTQFVCVVQFPAVPAGYGLSQNGTAPSVRVGINGNGIDEPQINLPAPVRTGFDSYIASGPITLYADAGDVPTVSLGGQFVQPASTTAQVGLVGHLIPAP
jgi:hypothetical protein